MNGYPEGEPCWAPGAADHLEDLLTGDEVGWEWGGGASSVWLASKVKFLSVVETDPQWALWIEERTERCQVQLLVRSYLAPDYTHVSKSPNLWLIDGYRRIDCLKLVACKAKTGDIVVADDALDYAEHRIERDLQIDRFSMPHPHAGMPCVSARNTRHRNTVRTHAPATKETWIWRV